MLLSKRAELIEILNKYIHKYGGKRFIRNAVTQEFKNRNLNSGYGNKIFNGRLELEALDIDKNEDLFILYSFTNGLYKALDDTESNTENNDALLLKPDIYFTPIECNNFQDLVLEVEESGYPYLLQNMLKVADGQYMGIISAKELSKLDKDIVYNFNTQRDAKIDKFGIKSINISRKKIDEIKARILSGDQFPDSIKINILRDGNDDVEFLTENGKIGALKIKSGEMDIFDGFHRKTASQMALLENSDLNFNWGITITNFTEKRAQDFMVQIDKQTRIRQEYIKGLDKTKFENLAVDLIVDNPLFELANKIKLSDQELRFGGYTKKSLLSTAIKDNYSEILTTKIKTRNISDWIVEFLNFISEFLNDKDYSTNKYMFMSYIALSKSMYGKGSWREDVNKILSSFDFNLSNNHLSFLKDIDGSNINNYKKNKIYNLFITNDNE